MNCSQLSQLISEVKSLQQPLLTLLDSGDLNILQNQKEAVEQKIDEFYAEYPPLASDFFETLERYHDVILYLQGDQEATQVRIERGVGKHCRFPIQNWDYKQFLRLAPDFLKKHGANADGWPLGFLNRLFLQNYLESNGHLRISASDLPGYLAANFGFCLKMGNYAINHLENKAFEYMEGGEVDLAEFSRLSESKNYPEICSTMNGGIVRIGEAEGNIGHKMRGGTITVENLSRANIAPSALDGTVFVRNFDLTDAIEENNGALTGSEFCFGAKGGTFVIDNVIGSNRFMVGARENATVLIKCKREQILNNPAKSSYGSFNGWIAYYDEEGDSFSYVDETRKIDDFKEVQYFALQTHQPGTAQSHIHSDLAYSILQLNSIDDIKSPLEYNLMTGGILIIKDARLDEIGKGMKGGVIIIDDPGLTYEEACERVAPRSERPGGVILYLKKWTKKGRFGFKKRKAEFVEIK